ncbi:MAG: hypothetical protein ACREP9_22810, partial [Candidatus Dormibacteraceae bacterium]
MLQQAQRVARRNRARSAAVGATVGLFLTVLTCAPAIRAARTQIPFQRALATPIKELDLRDQSALQGLLDLAYKYQFPLGIEYVDARLVRGQAHLYLRSTTVRAAVEEIVKRLPGYSVDFSGGLVDVYSAQARRDPLSALNMTIGRFQVTRVNAMDATGKLQDAVFASLHPGVGYGGDMGQGQTAPDQPRVTLRLNNRKVYQIMNAIVASDGAAIWLVVVPPANLARFDWNQWAVYNLNPIGEESIADHLKGLF